MISIVIPVWNQHEMTADCINVIRENTQDFELILVDNGSEPPIKAPFAGFADVTLIRNEANLGFPAAVNQGIRAANGDVIVLLNNDVVVPPGWADRLLRGLESFSIVGPMTNYCAGMQCTTIGAYGDIEELGREAEAWGVEYEGASAEVNWVIGFCMAFPRALFDELGPLDETMWPSSGEEIDFCFRARAAGHRVGIVCDGYVHHIGSQTFQEMHNRKLLDYGELCQATTAHLAEKWGDDFWSRQLVTVEENIAGEGI